VSAKTPPLSPSRQVIFHQMLVAARKSTLMDALSDALGEADPKVLKKQISHYVPGDAQRVLAASGIRDEHEDKAGWQARWLDRPTWDRTVTPNIRKRTGQRPERRR